jgi:hypothetical protein
MADDNSNSSNSSSGAADSPVQEQQTQSQLVSGPRTVRRSPRRGRGGRLPTKQTEKQPQKNKRKAPPAKKKSNEKNKKQKGTGADAAAAATVSKRTKNFSPEEDILISRAFIAATENECEGANKKGDAFYERVLEKFLAIYKQETAEDEQDEVVLNRNASAIQNRWSRHINKDVQLFNGYYKRVKDSKPSGNNEDDIYNLAMEEYRVQEGSKFRFLNCIHILYQVPKFNPMINSDEEKKQTPVNKVNTAMGANTPRPLGSKAAKQIYKQKLGLLEDATSAASTALAEKRIAAVEKVGKAGESLALVLKRKAERQHMMEMAKFYQSMGDNVQALELMKKVHEYDRQAEEEDKKAAAAEEEKKKPAMVEGSDKPPSVVEVVANNTNGEESKAAPEEEKETEEEEKEEEEEEDGDDEEEDEEESLSPPILNRPNDPNVEDILNLTPI